MDGLEAGRFVRRKLGVGGRGLACGENHVDDLGAACGLGKVEVEVVDGEGAELVEGELVELVAARERAPDVEAEVAGDLDEEGTGGGGGTSAVRLAGGACGGEGDECCVDALERRRGQACEPAVDLDLVWKLGLSGG